MAIGFSGHSSYFVGPALSAWNILKVKQYTSAVRSTKKVTVIVLTEIFSDVEPG